jgi:hypothetical protein
MLHQLFDLSRPVEDLSFRLKGREIGSRSINGNDSDIEVVGYSCPEQAFHSRAWLAMKVKYCGLVGEVKPYQS